MWEILHILSQTQWHSTVRLKVVLLSFCCLLTSHLQYVNELPAAEGCSMEIAFHYSVYTPSMSGQPRVTQKTNCFFLIWVCLGGLLHRPITGRPVNKNSTFKPGQTNECLNNEHRVFLSRICSYLSTREETWNYRLQ